jgi:hypothetical protein
MHTGIETWNTNLLDIGPMYPFVGSEMLLTVMGILVWLIWHLVQARAETGQVAVEETKYAAPGVLKQALDQDRS